MNKTLADYPGVGLFDLPYSVREDRAQIKARFVVPAVSATVSSHSALSNSDDLRNSGALPPELEITCGKQSVKSRTRNANCSRSSPAYLSLTKSSSFKAEKCLDQKLRNVSHAACGVENVG